MARIKRSLENLLYRLIRDGSENGDKNSSTPSSREPELAELLEKKNRQLSDWDETNRRRAAIHRKLKDRHKTTKRELKQLKEELKQTRRALESEEFKYEFAKRELDNFYLASCENLSRPGIQVRAAPDVETIRLRRDFLRHRHKVWGYPMRLGVLHQYSPRPPFEQRLPSVDWSASPLEGPTVSVVTPSFQQAAFLDRTLDSVLLQDYPNLEYFVMDGGSTDGSADLIRAKEAKLAGWVSEPDGGPASAVNKGFAQSGGELMAWLNSDDLWLPGVVPYVAQYFCDHPEVDVVYGHRLIVDGRDKQVGHWVLPPHDGEMLLWADYVPQETLFWRRGIWEKAGGMLDEDFQFAFDWELLLRFQRAGARIVRLPFFLGCFRTHEAQKSTADIETVGREEMIRLWERELGPEFDEDNLERLVVRFQRRAIWYDRLRRMKINR